MNIKKIKELTLKYSSGKTLLIIGIIGMVLICISAVFPKSSTDSSKKNSVSFSGDEYCRALEEKVRDMVVAITGNKQVTVVITLENSIRYSYADETNTATTEKSDSSSSDKTDESEKSFITIKGADGSEAALLITEYMPEIRGVTVVCKGINNATKENIEAALIGALGVTSRRVCVVAN